jgi:DNA-directed RNA polymerase subunit RPC12/RpoP
MGYLCSACGEAVPEDTPCSCSMADDADELVFERRWPETLAAAMRCQACGAEVAWRSEELARTGAFICSQCGDRRSSHNASKQLRRRAAERDGWRCHRCRLSIDPELSWPHPLALTADHYPVSRNDGGPAIFANLRAAHSLCNGSHGAVGIWQEGSRRYVITDFQRSVIEAIRELPRDDSGHIRPAG